MPYLAFEELGLDAPATATARNVKLTCPRCRDTRGNPRDRSLSLNLATGQFLCHHCGYKGTALRYSDQEKKEYKERMQATHRTVTASPRGGDYPAQQPQPQRPQPQPQRREYRRPAPHGHPLSAKAIAYFQGRGIGERALAALGVLQGEMFSPRQHRTVGAILFPYRLRGELRNIKTRSACKDFLLEKGCELLPFNLDAIEGRPECIITEGEIDALSFVECGIPHVISVPNGAGGNLSYLDAYMASHLDDKRAIYLAVDTDPAGLRLRDELLRRLGPARCRVITYGPGCKDANELLVARGPAALLAALAAAKEPTMEGVTTISDFADELQALYLHGMQPGATLGLDGLDQLISFETKRLCVITGIPGSGKSEFIDQMAERLNLRHGWKFAFFTPENAPTFYHSVKLIEKFTGKRFGQRTLPRDEFEEAASYLNDNFFYIEPKRPTLAAILGCAEFLVRRRGVKALVIDPYNRLENEAGDGSETLYISALLDALTDFAQRNDALVILVAHPRKMLRAKDGGFEIPTLYDISGSANFFNKADFGIVVDRDRKADTVLISVQKVKFKHLGHPGNALFKYHMASGRYAPFVAGEIPAFDTSNHIRAPASPAVHPAPALETEDQLPF